VALNTIEQTNKLIQHFEQSNCIDWINFYAVTDQDIVFLILDSCGKMIKKKTVTVEDQTSQRTPSKNY
jgi:hypothetical protein